MMKERLFFNMVNFIEIEISSLCNRKCLYCVQPMAQRKRELLPAEIVRKIADELKKIDFNGGIAFHQYNEPLLEKEHLFKCIRIIKENLPKAKLVLYTNGDLLTYKLFKQLIKLDIDEFEFMTFWLEEVMRNKITNNSYNSCRNVVNNYIIPQIGNKYMETVNRGNVQCLYKFSTERSVAGVT